PPPAHDPLRPARPRADRGIVRRLAACRAAEPAGRHERSAPADKTDPPRARGRLTRRCRCPAPAGGAARPPEAGGPAGLGGGGRVGDGPWDYGREKLRGVEVRDADGIAAVPFTSKAELRDAYPFGTLAVPREQTIRIHASSGTRGKPLVVAYTVSDVRVFAEVNARSIACAGGRASDVL